MCYLHIYKYICVLTKTGYIIGNRCTFILKMNSFLFAKIQLRQNRSSTHSIEISPVEEGRNSLFLMVLGNLSMVAQMAEQAP